MGRLVGSGWLQSCLATGASCGLILAVSWDNGHDGACVFSRLVWANSHGIPRAAMRTSPVPLALLKSFFGVTVIIVSLLKVCHMIQPIGHRGGTPLCV